MSRGWFNSRIGSFRLEAAWSVEPGEVLVLFGPSGAGKTQVLRAIAGLSRPREGSIRIGGSLVFDSGDGTWTPPHQRRVGYVPQDYGLFPHLSVRQNVAFGQVEDASGDRERRTGDLLETFRLADYALMRPHQLSSGQRQRVAIARALATSPRLLLLDEPFSALDAELRRSLRRELQGLLRQWGIPVILVTHDREDALVLGSHTIVLDKGRIVAEGAPMRVLGQPPTSLLADLVGVENLFRGLVTARWLAEGTMRCRVGEIDMQTPLGDVEEGEPVTLGVRSQDILLATHRPEGISARNLLQGRVVALEARSPGVEVAVECSGTVLRSQVTYQATHELGLRVGGEVWAIVKASSLFLVAPEAS